MCAAFCFGRGGSGLRANSLFLPSVIVPPVTYQLTFVSVLYHESDVVLTAKNPPLCNSGCPPFPRLAASSSAPGVMVARRLGHLVEPWYFVRVGKDLHLACWFLPVLSRTLPATSWAFHPNNAPGWCVYLFRHHSAAPAPPRGHLRRRMPGEGAR